MKKQKMLTSGELAAFCSQTAMLFHAGISPLESMLIMRRDETSPGGKRLLEEMIAVCRQGEPFYQALLATGAFPEYLISMVRLGEESGNPDVCMQSLADYYEKEESIAHSLKSAVAYPLIMIGMMMIVIFLLVSKVMPIFQKVFAMLGSEMSVFSASLVRLGARLNQYSLLFLILLLGVFCCYLFIVKTRAGKKCLHGVIKHLPLFKKYIDVVACERFARGMSLALSSGMDAYASLDLVTQLVGNAEMEGKIAKCKQGLMEGDNFAEALKKAEIFNHLYEQMIGVGVKSGKTDVVFGQIAAYYEKETDRRVETAISVLEPTLVILLSMIVGMILLSVILPLMGVMTSIG